MMAAVIWATDLLADKSRHYLITFFTSLNESGVSFIYPLDKVIDLSHVYGIIDERGVFLSTSCGAATWSHQTITRIEISEGIQLSADR